MIREISFTEQALNKIEQLIAVKKPGTYFRIAVKGGGCSGFQYDFSFDEKIETGDKQFKNVVIDSSSLELLKGSKVDYVIELIGANFKISNPKVKSECGCGVSFSL